MPSSPIRALAFAVLFALLPLPPSVLAAEAETLNGVPVEVLAWSTVEVAGGTVTFVRIRPPALSAMPLAAPTSEPAPAPDAAALAEEARLAAKACVDWQPAVIVHLRPPVVSELHFQVAGRPVTVWTNVDFRVLASISQWENASTVFVGFPIVTEIGPEDDVRPADLNLTPGPAEYVVEATAAELAGHEADLTPLDALLAYHDLHREALVAEQARREALAAELDRQAAEARTKPTATTIYFWKNE